MTIHVSNRYPYFQIGNETFHVSPLKIKSKSQITAFYWLSRKSVYSRSKIRYLLLLHERELLKKIILAVIINANCHVADFLLSILYKREAFDTILFLFLFFNEAFGAIFFFKNRV